MTNLVFSIVGMLVTNWVPVNMASHGYWLNAVHYSHRQEVQEIRHNTYLRVQQDENKWDLLLSSTVVTGIPLLKRQVPIEPVWQINPGQIIEPILLDAPEIRFGIHTNATITVDTNGSVLSVTNGVPTWTQGDIAVTPE